MNLSKNVVDKDAKAAAELSSMVEMPFAVLAPRYSLIRLVRAGFAALAIMAAVAVGMFALFAGRAELKAAERKTFALTTQGHTAVYASISKPRASHGKNVNAEPPGIALSGDSGEAMPLDSLAAAKPHKTKEKTSTAKTKKKSKTATIDKSQKTAPSKKAHAAKKASSKAVVSMSKEKETDSLIAKAQAQVDAGNYDVAAALYDEALAKDANDDAAWRGKAFALQQSDSPKAIDELHKMVAAKPFSGVAYEALGQAFMTQGDNQAAVLAFQKAVNLDPSNNDYVLRLAVLHDRLGHDAEALALYRKLKKPLPYAVKKRMEYLSSKEE